MALSPPAQADCKLRWPFAPAQPPTRLLCPSPHIPGNKPRAPTPTLTLTLTHKRTSAPAPAALWSLQTVPTRARAHALATRFPGRWHLFQTFSLLQPQACFSGRWYSLSGRMLPPRRAVTTGLFYVAPDARTAGPVAGSGGGGSMRGPAKCAPEIWLKKPKSALTLTAPRHTHALARVRGSWCWSTLICRPIVRNAHAHTNARARTYCTERTRTERTRAHERTRADTQTNTKPSHNPPVS